MRRAGWCSTVLLLSLAAHRGTALDLRRRRQHKEETAEPAMARRWRNARTTNREMASMARPAGNGGSGRGGGGSGGVPHAFERLAASISRRPLLNATWAGGFACVTALLWKGLAALLARLARHEEDARFANYPESFRSIQQAEDAAARAAEATTRQQRAKLQRRGWRRWSAHAADVANGDGETVEEMEWDDLPSAPVWEPSTRAGGGLRGWLPASVGAWLSSWRRASSSDPAA